MKMMIKLLSTLLSAAICLSVDSLTGCYNKNGPETRDVYLEL